MKLRPYQTEALARVSAAFDSGARRVLLVLPTGGGKTVCFGARTRENGGNTLIVAHRRELIRQASAKLSDFDVPHGLEIPGQTAHESVRVGSVQTLARRLDSLPRFSEIVLDEAHHAVTGQWAELLQSQPNARVLGVTATPERLDGRGLGDVFDSIVVGPTVPELIAGEFLTPSRVFAPAAIADLRRASSAGGDFLTAEVEAAMSVPGVVGDAVEHYGWHCPGQPAVAFCVSVTHAEKTAEAFRSKGWRAVALSGKSPVEQREAGLAGLATGAVEIVCSCSLIDEGLDVPAISAVIDLAPTESLGRYLQRGGRGMRPAPGKRALTVLDHAGNTFRHGLLDSAREWSLEGRKRRAASPPAVRQCDTCYAIFSPRSACPACGAACAPTAQAGPRRLVAADGTLIELTDDQIRLAAAPLRDLVREARSFRQLEEIRVARGYARGWTETVMAAKGRARARFA